MIARIWSAQATPEHAPAYTDHFRSQVLPILGTVEGYAGAMLLERVDSGAVEITVITFWRSLDSIRAFAGPGVEEAVVADEAAALLTRVDRHVRHCTLVLKQCA